MIKQLVAIALLLSVASATIPSFIPPSTGLDATAASFVNSTINLVWSMANPYNIRWHGGVETSLCTFGPTPSPIGNGIVYAYGVGITTSTTIVITTRAINSTLVINGTAAVPESSSILGDYQAIVNPVSVNTYDGRATVCAGLGSLAVMYQDTDATNNYLNVWAVISSGPVSSPIQLSQGTSKAPAANAAGIAYFNLQCVYDLAGYYYFAWSTQSVSATPSYVDSGVFVQGVNTSNSNAFVWKAPLSPTATTNTGAFGSSTLNLQLGLSNITNASTVYLAYNSISGGINTLKLFPATVLAAQAGTAGSTSPIKAEAAIGVVGTAYYVDFTYTAIGFAASDSNLPIVLVQNKSTTGASSTVAYGLSQYNISAARLTQSNAKVSTSCIPTQATGGPYGAVSSHDYYIVLGCDVAAHGTATYSFQTFNSKELTNSAPTLAVVKYNYQAASSPYPQLNDFTQVSPGSSFVDSNGALWFGYTLYDPDSADISIAGYLGQVATSTYSTAGSFGSLLSASLSLFALIAAILAF